LRRSIKSGKATDIIFGVIGLMYLVISNLECF